MPTAVVLARRAHTHIITAAPDRVGTSSRPGPRAGPPPRLQAFLLDLSEAHPIRARSTRIDLVVEHIEAEGGLCLRHAVELPLKAPDLLRCCQAHRQSPHLTIFESAPEVRVLCLSQWSAVRFLVKPRKGVTKRETHTDLGWPHSAAGAACGFSGEHPVRRDHHRKFE